MKQHGKVVVCMVWFEDVRLSHNIATLGLLSGVIDFPIVTIIFNFAFQDTIIVTQIKGPSEISTFPVSFSSYRSQSPLLASSLQLSPFEARNPQHLF